MSGTVVALAVAVAAVNAVPALLGGWGWYRAEPSRAFWVCLRVGQGSAVLLAVVVGALAVAGKQATEQLFYLYALLPLAIAFIAEQLRLTAAQAILDGHRLENGRAVGQLPASEQAAIVGAILRREMGIMALSALVVVFLVLRAASTAHGF
jgi:hypothetical protein